MGILVKKFISLSQPHYTLNAKKDNFLKIAVLATLGVYAFADS